jgi:hypothetical protein
LITGLDVEADLVALHISSNFAAVLEFAEQNLLGQRLLELVLNHARKRPSSHQPVVALVREPFSNIGTHIDLNVLGEQLAFELQEMLADDLPDGQWVKRVEVDDRIQAIPELRRERLFNGLLRSGSALSARTDS